MSDVIARLPPSTPRRLFAIGALLALGGAAVWFALFDGAETPGMRVVLIGFGIIVLALAEALRRATSFGLELTRAELRTTRGEVLVRVDDIVAIDRGVFAFKPASGFILRVRRGGPFGWSPGLWWRIGRRIGVGGVTGRDEGRYMADVIAAVLMERGPPG